MHNHIKTSLILLIFAIPPAIGATEKDDKVITPANDKRIEYTGRTQITQQGVSYDWSGVYARIRFEGKSIAIKCSDTHGDWFNVWIDKEMSPKEDDKIFVNSKDTTITLAENLRKGTHQIILQKRTEGEQGTFTLHAIITDKNLLPANSRKKRHIEFIGDSYTCGYGTESVSRSEPFRPETENCNLTYAAITARYFDADFTLISHSGQGVARNYDDFEIGYNMPERYGQTFDMNKEIKWTPKENIPDIVVIYLGTNDFSTEKQPWMETFSRKYTILLEKIKNNYGAGIPIICMASRANPLLYEYVKNTCLKCGWKNISYFGLENSVHNNDSDLGASWHPNYNGHKKVASCLIPYISTITGWEMEEKPYR